MGMRIPFAARLGAVSSSFCVEKYGTQMKMVDRIPDALSGAMGNQMYLANFPTKEEMDQFYYDAVLCN